MPELPEVEVTRMGIEPHIKQQQVRQIIIRNGRLRWPIPDEIQNLVGHTVLQVERRAKYLLIKSAAGTAILHLGMSGKLCVVDKDTPIQKHDHVDIEFANDKILRYNDPRRFGSLLWQDINAPQHRVLGNLGPEPFDEIFSGEYLYELSRNKKSSIKQFIMENKIVVGVGNIYANEALFQAGIDPKRAAGNVSKKRYQTLAPIIINTLKRAIEQGGTTLKDFAQADGKPGYFAQELMVYGRKGLPCVTCEEPLSEIKLGQRSTVYCNNCQS
ncbi:MAG: formamidopyrimidine-DNA glycosylase [Phenylobacterium sp.]|jgi:formamidopyrimidine-DNA glycosylase